MKRDLQPSGAAALAAVKVVAGALTAAALVLLVAAAVLVVVADDAVLGVPLLLAGSFLGMIGKGALDAARAAAGAGPAARVH